MQFLGQAVSVHLQRGKDKGPPLSALGYGQEEVWEGPHKLPRMTMRHTDTNTNMSPGDVE